MGGCWLLLHFFHGLPRSHGGKPFPPRLEEEKFMRFPILSTLAATLILAGCSEKETLPDTLMFPPGLDIQYQGQAAKLYGTAKCAQGQLTGNSCLIFPPERPEATGIIIAKQQVYQVELQARRDPQDPVRFVIEDAKGQRIFSTTGRHDEHANIQLAP
ncbi:MAG: hypothetical protein Q4B46_07255 [Comamonadaceae bacterium]|nr:hypothetical protein [Comamonadaceae bacterium]